MEHHQPMQTLPRPNSSHQGGSVAVPIQLQQQQAFSNYHQQQQMQQHLQQQILQQQYQQQLQAGDRRSYSSNHSSSSDRSASNASVAASNVSASVSATPLSASRQYRRYGYRCYSSFALNLMGFFRVVNRDGFTIMISYARTPIPAPDHHPVIMVTVICDFIWQAGKIGRDGVS